MMWRTPAIMPDLYNDPYYYNRRYNSLPSLPMISNPQPIRYRRHFPEYFVDPIIESPRMPYIDDGPFIYERTYTPSLIEESPYTYYEPPIRRRVRDVPKPDKKVHLPQHTKKLVNRFLSNLEHAHEHQHVDGNDSDCSIDDCDVCRRLKTVIDGRKRQNTHNHRYSNNCNLCNLVEKQDKHVHVIETLPTNPKPTHLNPLIQPVTYPTYIDPATGLTYTYDSNWQYNPTYYANPPYIQNNPPYETYKTTQTVVADASNPVMDKATYTHMTNDDGTHKSNNKTVIVHTSRDPTPPAPQIIIEQPRRHHHHHHHRRIPRKIRSTTLVKERTIREPRLKTTTYI